MKYQRITPPGCKYKGISKFECMAKTQFLKGIFIDFKTTLDWCDLENIFEKIETGTLENFVGGTTY